MGEEGRGEWRTEGKRDAVVGWEGSKVEECD